MKKPRYDETLGTWEAYEKNAVEYAMSTRDFSAFPGLRAEVAEFEQRCPPGYRLLDLGCGAGRDSRFFASLGRKVVSADLSAALLHQSRLSSTAEMPSLVQCEMPALPFRSGAFGGIWACGSFLHLPSSALTEALVEARRVLADGGILAASMKKGREEGWRSTGRLSSARWFTLVEPDEFLEKMTAAGFSYTRYTFSGRGNWFVAYGYAGTTAPD